MDIKKLAAEMGLKCITTYKLDALKAVRRKNESNDEPNMCNSKDNNYITSQNSDSMKLHKEVPSIAAEGLNGDKSCKEKGRWILIILWSYTFLFFFIIIIIYFP